MKPHLSFRTPRPVQAPHRPTGRFRALLSLALLAPSLGEACPVCRPKVQAAIHTADYASTAALLLLPVAVLLVLGLALYWADNRWPRPKATTSLKKA